MIVRGNMEYEIQIDRTQKSTALYEQEISFLLSNISGTKYARFYSIVFSTPSIHLASLIL